MESEPLISLALILTVASLNLLWLHLFVSKLSAWVLTRQHRNRKRRRSRADLASWGSHGESSFESWIRRLGMHLREVAERTPLSEWRGGNPRLGAEARWVWKEADVQDEGDWGGCGRRRAGQSVLRRGGLPWKEAVSDPISESN